MMFIHTPTHPRAHAHTCEGVWKWQLFMMRLRHVAGHIDMCTKRGVAKGGSRDSIVKGALVWCGAHEIVKLTVPWLK